MAHGVEFFMELKVKIWWF